MADFGALSDFSHGDLTLIDEFDVSGGLESGLYEESEAGEGKFLMEETVQGREMATAFDHKSTRSEEAWLVCLLISQSFQSP